jgi:hypothetical protein
LLIKKKKSEKLMNEKVENSHREYKKKAISTSS